MQSSKLIYWLDSNNCISSIIGPWDVFALKNEGGSACTAHVLGRPIEEFIAGDETRMQLLVLISAVRTLGTARTKEYRCDSPTEKRFMQMTVSKELNGQLKIEHTLLKLEPKEYPLFIKPDLSASKKTTLRCSICNRLNVKGLWQEEAQIIRNNQITPNSVVLVAYTVCPDCIKK